MADHTEDSLIREIDEELRQDQFQKVWSRYGKLFLAAAGLCVAAVAGYQFWIQYDLDNRRALGERFDQAQQMAAGDKSDAAVNAFKTLTEEGGGYALLARFQEAALMAKQGDAAGALVVYDEISKNSDAGKLYQELAQLLASGIQINQPDADAAAIQNRLTPLAAAGNPWRFSAQELMAALALKTGDTAKAKEIYGELSKDSETPARMRQRATEMLTILR